MHTTGTDKREYIRKVQSVHSTRPVTPEPVHAAHIDDGHRNRRVNDNNAYARPAGPHQSTTLAPIRHVRQALQSTPTRKLHSTNLKGRVSPLVRGIPTTNTHHEHQYTYQTSAAEPYVQNATAKTTTRSTSANGARHQLRTAQSIAILRCCA